MLWKGYISFSGEIAKASLSVINQIRAFKKMFRFK